MLKLSNITVMSHTNINLESININIENRQARYNENKTLVG